VSKDTMSIKRIAILTSCCAFLFALAGCKSLQEVAQSKKFTQPEGVTLMTEQNLRDTLVGNTYKGDSVRYPGSTYIEYIHPDGKISGLWNGQERYKGEWVISDKLWCYKYKNSNGKSEKRISCFIHDPICYFQKWITLKDAEMRQFLYF
jgi:hypothetical protein